MHLFGRQAHSFTDRTTCAHLCTPSLSLADQRGKSCMRRLEETSATSREAQLFQRLLNQGNIHCPLLQLPPEVLGAILETVIATPADRWERAKGRLNVMASCRQLRQAVMDVPSSIDVESLSKGAISLSLYSLQERTTTRPFDFRFHLPEFNWLFLPTCASLFDDPGFMSSFIKRRQSGQLAAKKSAFVNADEQSLGMALVQRKTIIRTLDITGNIEKMPKWRELVCGDLPSLQRLRLWSENHHSPYDLPLKAGRLTTLIVNRCIPPSEGLPNLRYLVVHGLSEGDWPYDHILDFLSKAPRLENLDFDGLCLPKSTGLYSRTVDLRALQKAVLGAHPVRVSQFLRNLNLNIRKLSLEFTFRAFWPNVDLASLSGRCLDHLENVIFCDRVNNNIAVRLLHRTLFIYRLDNFGETPVQSCIDVFFEESPSQVYLHNILRCFPNCMSIHTSVEYGGFDEWRRTIASILLDGRAKVVIYTETGEPILGLEGATFLKGKVVLPTTLGAD